MDLETLLRERAITNKLNTQIAHNQLLNGQLDDASLGNDLAIVQLSVSSRQENNEDNQRRRLNNVQQHVHVVGTGEISQTAATSSQDEQEETSQTGNGVRVIQQNKLVNQLNRDDGTVLLINPLNNKRLNEQLERTVSEQSNGQKTLLINHADRNGNGGGASQQRQLLERPIWGHAWTSSPLRIITRRVL